MSASHHAEEYEELKRREGNGAKLRKQTPNAEPLFRQAWEIVAERRETMWLIPKILEAGVLAVIAGPRGTFKSFIGLDWLMRIAVAGHTVVILSGEGGGIGQRIEAWLLEHAPHLDIKSLSILVRERPLNLRLPLDMVALEDAIAALPKAPAVVMVDTFSKFSAGIDENDNSQVAAYLAKLSECLRERFNSTVLLVAHSGHGDGGRPRGASALMANPDAEYIVQRANPTDMTVTVTRERFKDTASLPPLAYEARVIALGRFDSQGERVTSIALHATDVPAMSAKSAGGKNQQKAIVALKEWTRANADATHISSLDMKAILKTQGLDRFRQREAVNFLVNVRVLTAATGGHLIDKGML